ncbi:MAG: ATP-dependent metallopeptidase FtsH/Yme1/Tma family protein [Deltaproteobacteria bacterium]|nr:MAG: ATP-dependent metallopeptidase FtsH/Yme1/Tma family protein [Deltaproteobacteria bacterium]
MFLIFSILQATLFSGVDAEEISYSRFRQEVAEGQVRRVVITDRLIYGERVAEGDEVDNADPTGTPAPGAAGGSDETEGSDTLEVPARPAPWHLGHLWKQLTGGGSGGEASGAQVQRRRFTVVPVKDPDLVPLLLAHGVDFRARIESRWLQTVIMNWIVPFGILFLIWGALIQRMGKGPGMLSIGRNRARIYEVDEEARVRFSDLAGVDEAIEETREVVEFLHDPSRYERLGAKLPKGILLVGPPGTGKTLLARAIAGEAGVPFFSLSGSDFVEMFVGVGAARVRDLFDEAKRRAPCIIFIDELDAVGKARVDGSGIPGVSNDERENTLNQLLVEMDGFDTSAGVVLIAATNRPEILDKALLRPGRFDRRIVLDRPSHAGRVAIFKIHTRKLRLGDDVDFEALAAQTPGMVGADIANVCNEAAILASRRNSDTIDMADFQAAIERTIAGPQRKSRVVSPHERRRIAHHEAGHALIGHLTPGADPIQKVSIIPRGEGALGYTLQMPLEDRYLMSRTELLDRIRILLGGRAAEEVTFGEVSTGASDDLEKASQIARQMLQVYGMGEAAPNLSLVQQSGPGFLSQGWQKAPVSERLEEAMDAEMVAIIDGCYKQAVAALRAHRDRLDRLAATLLDKEDLGRKEVEELLGDKPSAPPWGSPVAEAGSVDAP